MVYLLLMTFILSFLLTWILRRYALARNVLDVPNHRSAHAIPTPRGGGVAFVCTVLISILFLKKNALLTPDGSIALMMAGVFVASLGFLDDHGHIAPIWRLTGHFIASVLALYWLGGFPSLMIFSWALPLGFFADVLGVLYLVWLINLYNFMDGIDGLAGVELLCVCCGMSFIYWVCGGLDSLMVLPLVLSASVTGFLCWNFPPARIFMGDAGSGFLGFIVGVLSIQASGIHPQFFWCWLILLGVFIVDTTITLGSRLLRLEKIYEAHSTHGYQYAARYFGRHLPVTLGVLVLNVAWLLPIAVAVGLEHLDGPLGLLMAYVPLVLLATWFNAGKRPDDETRVTTC
ncbi:MAG: MraY family glycosyltransferase [Legionellaceae bacterium]